MTAFFLGLGASILGIFGIWAEWGEGGWSWVLKLLCLSLACSGMLAVLAGFISLRKPRGG